MKAQKSGGSRITRVVLTLGLASTLLLGACSAGGGGTPAASSGGVTTIKVGVLALAGSSPIYIGNDQGYFAAAGLDVQPEIFANGTAATAALVSGEIDLAFSNYYSPIFANQQGISLKLVAEGEVSRDQQITVQVLPDSPIKTPADLLGHTVAVTSLKNNGDIGTTAILDYMGLDASKVTFVEMASGDMGAALQRGTVDAVWVTEPTRSAIMATLNTRDVMDNNSPPLDHYPQNGYFGTSTWVGNNAKAVAAFQCGLSKASAYANADENNVRQVLPEFTKFTPDVIAGLHFNEYATAIDVSQVQRPADILLQQGLISAPFDASSMVVATPTSC